MAQETTTAKGAPYSVTWRIPEQYRTVVSVAWSRNPSRVALTKVHVNGKTKREG